VKKLLPLLLALGSLLASSHAGDRPFLSHIQSVTFTDSAVTINFTPFAFVVDILLNGARPQAPLPLRAITLHEGDMLEFSDGTSRSTITPVLTKERKGIKISESSDPASPYFVPAKRQPPRKVPSVAATRAMLEKSVCPEFSLEDASTKDVVAYLETITANYGLTASDRITIKWPEKIPSRHITYSTTKSISHLRIMEVLGERLGLQMQIGEGTVIFTPAPPTNAEDHTTAH
jgi:hypothetical protein